MRSDPDVHSLRELVNWPRLRRFFHFEGNLGGLRYEARLRIFELSAGDNISTAATDIAPAPELQAWESEGGAQIMESSGEPLQHDAGILRVNDN